MLFETHLTKPLIDLLKKDETLNLNILGILENNPECIVFTDSAEKPTGIFIKEDYFHYLYTENMEFVDVVLKEHMSNGSFGFSGVIEPLARYIQKKRKLDWQNSCTVYSYPENTVSLKNDLADVRTLRLEDAERVNEYYTYKGEHSLDEIRQDIQNRPSSAVFVNNEPVCWVLIHEDNSMGIMYTMEEYRRKGLAEIVTLDLVSKVLEKGKTPYLQIVDGNDKSHELAKKCGFRPVGRCAWFGIVAGDVEE